MRVRRIKPASLLNIAGRDDDVAQQLWLNIAAKFDATKITFCSSAKRPQLASSVFSWKWPDACRAPMQQLCRFMGDSAGLLDIRIETVSRTLTHLARSGA